MNVVLNLVVVAASIIGAGMALPQAIRLVTTRRSNGVSGMWIGVSLAINLWWVAYAVAASVPVLLPVSVVSFVLYATMAVTLIRIGQADRRGDEKDTEDEAPVHVARRSQGLSIGASMAVGAFGLGLVPLPVLLLGGWTAAGVAVGLCYGIQLLPAVVAACRTRELDGVSRGTWLLSFVEGVLWLIYGAAVLDGALIAGGVTGVVMAAVILVRLEVTGHRPFAGIGSPRRVSHPAPLA